MTAAQNRCVECDDIIANPVCPNCLAAQMMVMVGEYDQNLVNCVKGISIEGDITCIICNERMGLCAHCFSKDIYCILSEKNQKISKEFLQRFDFDLRKELI
ncbi:hypothetical protein J4479_02695 [Candidatus Woesearchaeota archaeon]|nr:hypothetical protein [Candidatus Woesearchaeota archaeon]